MNQDSKNIYLSRDHLWCCQMKRINHEDRRLFSVRIPDFLPVPEQRRITKKQPVFFKKSWRP